MARGKALITVPQSQWCCFGQSDERPSELRRFGEGRSYAENKGGEYLSFADGHVGCWQWQVPKIFINWFQAVPPQEMPDYQRIQAAMKQHSDN
jgi:hypothetical protein